MRSLLSLATAVLLLAAASGALAAGTSSGKSTAYLTVSSVPLGPVSAPLGQATILQGKKKRMLQAEVLITAKGGYADSIAAVQLDVNGTVIEPGAGNFQRIVCDNGYINCTVSALFWADLDALEAASPGTFVNVPLVITAHGATVTGSGVATVTIRSRMVKK